MPTLQFLLLLAVCVTSTWLGFRLSQSRPAFKQPLLAFGFAMLAAILAVSLFSDRLPGPLQLPMAQGFLGELALATAFVVIGVLAVYYRNTWSQPLLHDVLAIALVYFVLAEPFHFSLKADEIRSLDYGVKKSVTLQGTHYTCTPAALATVLRRWGL